jgi:hypothetical protein
LAITYFTSVLDKKDQLKSKAFECALSIAMLSKQIKIFTLTANKELRG